MSARARIQNLKWQKQTLEELLEQGNLEWWEISYINRDLDEIEAELITLWQAVDGKYK